MVEDGEDWNGLEMMILKSLAIFSKYTNDNVASLNFENFPVSSWRTRTLDSSTTNRKNRIRLIFKLSFFLF